MKTRIKSNDLIATLIAAALFAAGFALSFLHHQQETAQQSPGVRTEAPASPREEADQG